MKKIMILALLAICTLGASAQKVYKKQVETATKYAQMAQEEFKLSDETTAKVLEIKKSEFAILNSTLKPMKEAGKSKEEIQAKSKEVRKPMFTEQTETIGCTKKELMAFNKSFAAKMKADK